VVREGRPGAAAWASEKTNEEGEVRMGRLGWLGKKKENEVFLLAKSDLGNWEAI
jgi:hypothetical protein